MTILGSGLIRYWSRGCRVHDNSNFVEGTLVITDQSIIIEIERTRFFGLIHEGKHQMVSFEYNNIQRMVPVKSKLNKKQALMIKTDSFELIMDFPGNDINGIIKSINDTFNIIKGVKEYKPASVRREN